MSALSGCTSRSQGRQEHRISRINWNAGYKKIDNQINTGNTMKKLLLIAFIALIVCPLHAQDITGQWNGFLDVMGNQMKLVFHIEKSDSGYSARFDSPDQGAKDIPFTSASYDVPNLKLTSDNIAAVYKGVFKTDSLIGTWNQGGRSFQLNMYRDDVEKTKPNRPQYPERPYPYSEELVTFKNKADSLILAGTLTVPDKSGPHPAVILISGSGPQNRDEEIFGHKSFLVLADHLTRNGIAVLRYDDRGTAQSTGDHSTATSEDFARDAQSAVEFLKNHKEVDTNNIGLIGHSEGGLIAPIVANDTDDVAFVVLLAGTGVPGKEIFLMQARTQTPLLDIPDKEAHLQFVEKALQIASSQGDIIVLKERLTQHYKQHEHIIRSMLPEETNVIKFIKQEVEASLSPWARFFSNYDPVSELNKLTIPVLSLIGSNDVQVPVEMNHPPIREALEEAGNKHYTIKELEGLNHMFQESETGNVMEYAKIEQTFSPIALDEVTRWIKSHIR